MKRNKRIRVLLGKHEEKLFREQASVMDRMEAFLETDFSGICLNISEDVGKFGADALAVDETLYFNRDCYDPNSSEGLKLLGHELAHILQQRQGRVRANSSWQSLPFNGDQALEAEADEAGEWFASACVDSKYRNRNIPSPVFIQPGALQARLAGCGVVQARLNITSGAIARNISGDVQDQGLLGMHMHSGQPQAFDIILSALDEYHDVVDQYGDSTEDEFECLKRILRGIIVWNNSEQRFRPKKYDFKKVEQIKRLIGAIQREFAIFNEYNDIKNKMLNDESFKKMQRDLLLGSKARPQYAHSLNHTIIAYSRESLSRTVFKEELRNYFNLSFARGRTVFATKLLSTTPTPEETELFNTGNLSFPLGSMNLPVTPAPGFGLQKVTLLQLQSDDGGESNLNPYCLADMRGKVGNGLVEVLFSVELSKSAKKMRKKSNKYSGPIEKLDIAGMSMVPTFSMPAKDNAPLKVQQSSDKPKGTGVAFFCVADNRPIYSASIDKVDDDFFTVVAVNKPNPKQFKHNQGAFFRIISPAYLGEIVADDDDSDEDGDPNRAEAEERAEKMLATAIRRRGLSKEAANAASPMSGVSSSNDPKVAASFSHYRFQTPDSDGVYQTQDTFIVFKRGVTNCEEMDGRAYTGGGIHYEQQLQKAENRSPKQQFVNSISYSTGIAYWKRNLPRPLPGTGYIKGQSICAETLVKFYQATTHPDFDRVRFIQTFANALHVLPSQVQEFLAWDNEGQLLVETATGGAEYCPSAFIFEAVFEPQDLNQLSIPFEQGGMEPKHAVFKTYMENYVQGQPGERLQCIRVRYRLVDDLKQNFHGFKLGMDLEYSRPSINTGKIEEAGSTQVVDLAHRWYSPKQTGVDQHNQAIPSPALFV